MQILFDKHTEDGQRTMHNVHGSDVKTRKAEKIDLFTNAKLGTRAVPRDPAKSRLFRDLLNAIRRPPMPPASLASALTPNTNNDNSKKQLKNNFKKQKKAANATNHLGLCSNTKHQQRQQKWRL